MKQFTLLTLALIIFIAACKTKQDAPKNGELFTITGSLNKLPFDTFYLGEMKRVDSLPIIVDSAIIQGNANIKLSAISTNTSLYALYVKETMPNGTKGLMPILFFVNDTKAIKFNLDWEARKEYTTENSPATKNLKDYFNKIDSVTTWQKMASKTMDSLQKKKAKDTATLLAINTKFENDYKALSAAVKNEFEKITFGNLANFYFMVAKNTNALTLDDKNELMVSLRKKFPEAMNTKAPELTMADPLGKKISISQFKGKYILLDFWASWCAPCRAENPNVVAAFNKFKNRNFTILGISLDENAEAWKKAIQDDGLTWQHMSDLKGWATPAVQMYQFEGIPYNVLIDTDGNIIAKIGRASCRERV